MFITKTRFINSSLAQDGLNYSPSHNNGTDMCSESGCTGNRLVMFSSDDKKQMISPEAHAYLSSSEKPLCQKVTNYFLCHNQSLQLLQIENWKYFQRQTLDVSTLVGRQNDTRNETNSGNLVNNTMRVDSVKGMQIGKYIYDRQIWQAMSHNNHTNVVSFRGETPYNLRFRL